MDGGIPHTTLPPEATALRAEVRAFLAHEMRDFPTWQRAQTWMGYDRAFSRKLAQRGWIGMTWPTSVGGGGRSAHARYVLTEELLAAGAPVGAHWIGDRQSGPLIIRLGTKAQQQRILPQILRGDAVFCIGLSEADAGSDLSAIRSTAQQQANGSWRMNGRKVWTTGAEQADYMIALLRSSGTAADRHKGLSQFVIPMRTEGVQVTPIATVSGDTHFNEVLLDDVRLPADALLGTQGNGWAQAMGELALERSGVERFLSCWPLLEQMLQALRTQEPTREQAVAIGEYMARVGALRHLSVGVAGMLEQGLEPTTEAALVKEQGSLVEQMLPDTVMRLLDIVPSSADSATDLQRALAYLLQTAPSFSLRGGTREILRGIVARGMGLR